jgi:hypothetical protein
MSRISELLEKLNEAKILMQDHEIFIHPKYASAQSKFDDAMVRKDSEAAKKHRADRDKAYKELKYGKDKD